MTKGSVNSLETFGLLDGPGIRTVVFLNGCHLRCKYCHNPEMWLCGENNMTCEEVAKKIIRNKPYFRRNNGGVTFSGGEPLLQGEFLLETCKLLKKEQIHIAFDTAGVGDENYYDELLDLADLVILDIKHIDPSGYRELTGRDIDEFNKFKNYLAKHNVELWIRQVVVPGVHDNLSYITRLKEYLQSFKNITKIEFIPYHKLGIEKYETLGIKYPLKNIEPMNEEQCKKLYEKFLEL